MQCKVQEPATDAHAARGLCVHAVRKRKHLLAAACVLVVTASVVQILLELNRTTITCPVYVQWCAGDVLTCRASAHQFVSRVGDATPGAVAVWDLIDDTPSPPSSEDGDAATGDKSGVSGASVVSGSSAGSAGEASQCKHVCIQGRRGPWLAGKIVAWLEERLEALDSEQAESALNGGDELRARAQHARSVKKAL